jgi:hypothetical protein
LIAKQTLTGQDMSGIIRHHLIGATNIAQACRGAAPTDAATSTVRQIPFCSPGSHQLGLNSGVQRLSRRRDHIVRQAGSPFPHLYAAAVGAIFFRDFHDHFIHLLSSRDALLSVFGHPGENVFPDRFNADIFESRSSQPP